MARNVKGEKDSLSLKDSGVDWTLDCIGKHSMLTGVPIYLFCLEYLACIFNGMQYSLNPELFCC